ncbi:CaiB/BaiF CoA transferase family protein [Thioalkalivibrio sp. HK1]|uniref:CaiB/BaiF CoA transferase family protein n=1 Tax=Thioalkalivibrio sp. HK1 TaxID=1469245 RepID=UPI00046EE890|nr:CaiB/BaiF CoA-transferase family protein [Thioalkalivibrio sp. HK1]
MGPLEGVRIIELAGLGPGPFAAMVLADMGAQVIRVDRRSAAGSGSRRDALKRGRRSIALDLKKPEAVEVVLRLAERSDALIEGFRPGVTERLGLGPEVVGERNPKLVYGRVTGWGQSGPLAPAAGHDINYIALSGALASIARAGEAPVPPLNLVGDFGGGGMFLALGVVAGVMEARSSGKGQVVDVAMTEASAILMTMIYAMYARGMWSLEPGTNLLDSGAHFYDTYRCRDGKYIALGSIEPRFYAELREKAGLCDAAFDTSMDRKAWPELKRELAEVIARKTRREWCDLMEGSDVCFAPVLDMAEAPEHPHNIARRSFVEIEGTVQPAPVPRFSRTECELSIPPAIAGEHTDETLRELGFDADEIEALRAVQAI